MVWSSPARAMGIRTKTAFTRVEADPVTGIRRFTNSDFSDCCRVLVSANAVRATMDGFSSSRAKSAGRSLGGAAGGAAARHKEVQRRTKEGRSIYPLA